MEFNAQAIQMRPIVVRTQVTLAELAAAAKALGMEHEPATLDWGGNVGAEIIDDVAK